MNDKTLTVTVVGRRCVYINDYRVAGSKPYVSENLPSWSFEADINDLRYAIGRRPSSANKALQARIEALREALAEQVEACFCPDCEMCFRHEQLLKETGQ